MQSVKDYFAPFDTEIEKYAEGVHLLNEGAEESAVRAFEGRYAVRLPYYYREWLKIHNGGELFAVPAGTVLSGLCGDNEPIAGESYLESNFDPVKRGGVPPEIFIIADTNFGDVIGFDLTRTNQYDGKVVEWSHESGEISQTWESLIEWLTDELEQGAMTVDYNGDDK